MTTERTAFPIVDKDIREAYDSLCNGYCLVGVATKCRDLFVELQRLRSREDACDRPATPPLVAINGTIVSVGSVDGQKWDIRVHVHCARDVAGAFGSRVYKTGALRLSIVNVEET